MSRWLLALAAVLVVLTNTSWRIRRSLRTLEEEVQAPDRYVDIGATLTVVRRDPTGSELIPGLPKMRALRSYNFGGVIDTKAARPHRVGPSLAPQQWFCSEDQEPVILHRDSQPVGTLALGGMGAGKTTSGAIWTYLRWLENLGHFAEGGITAPTNERLDLVFKEIFRMFPANWYRFQSSAGIITMCDGTSIRGVSTYRQSASQGSRIQGFNWWWWLGDELQDQIAEFVNIQARLRAKPDGKAKRLATATAKDESEWRDLKTGMQTSGLWSFVSMLGPSSPFVHPSHWESMRKMTTERDYRRLVLAEDLPPESRVYSTWDRKHNLRPAPVIGARKITSIVLRRKTNDPRHALLIGNDPGSMKAASIFLDAYELPGEPDPAWWVRAELFTLHKSTEEHARLALAIARERFGVNIRPDGEQAHVRSQPVGQAEDRPDLNVYSIFKRVGFDIKAAQYATSKNASSPTGQIKKESRIEMVKRLLCDATGRRRLFVDIDEQGKPVAPKLVEAFETMERDHKGRAEHEEKDENDPSDCPAALGYALWPFEKEAAVALRADIARSVRDS